MSLALFDEIARCIDEGVAPGGAVALRSPDGNKTEQFAYCRFAGVSSPMVTADTIYDVASITKLFTTALVLRLHENGKLSINNRCADYLANFHGSEIRLTDLLTHRAATGISFQEFRTRYPTADSLHQALLAYPAPANAADAVIYTNAAFFYLGIIVEQVAKRPLQDQLCDLCAELGLSQTTTGITIAEKHIPTPPTELVDDEIVQSVTHDETARLFGGLAGHAGVFSSAADLAAFGSAWLAGKIVAPKTLYQLVFKDYDPAGTTPQALGWWLRVTGPAGQRPTPGVYSHTGFTGPFLGINPVNGKVAAFTCNRTYYGRENTQHRQIWQLLATWLAS